MSEKKYQRGHAYIEILNDGYFTRMDFPAKDVPLLEEIRTEALRRIRELWCAESLDAEGKQE